MAVGDLFQVIHKQRFLGQDAMNVYHYRLQFQAVANTALELREAWRLAVSSAVLNICSTAVNYVGIDVYNLFDVADFDLYPTNGFGSRAGDALPSFVSWTFRLNRSNRLTRNGRKAFAGVAEQDQDDGIPNPAIVGALTDLAALMSSMIVSPNGNQYAPVIIRRPLPTFPPGVFSYIETASFSRISTQNTRKS